MELVTVLLGIALRYGPEAYAKAVEIAHKTDPTKDDYLALHAILKTRGPDYFLPAGQAPQ